MDFSKSKIIGKLPNGKPIVLNDDGSISTVFSDIVNDKRINAGKPSLIPTIFGGKFLSTDEAADVVVRNSGFDPETKEQVPSFNSMKEGILASKELSKRHGEVFRMMKARGLLKLLGIDKELDF